MQRSETPGLYDARNAICFRLSSLRLMTRADMSDLLKSLGQVESQFFRTEVKSLGPRDIGNISVRQFILKYGGSVDRSEELSISWWHEQVEWVNMIDTLDERETIDEARNNEKWVKEDNEFWFTHELPK